MAPTAPHQHKKELMTRKQQKQIQNETNPVASANKAQAVSWKRSTEWESGFEEERWHRDVTMRGQTSDTASVKATRTRR